MPIAVFYFCYYVIFWSNNNSLFPSSNYFKTSELRQLLTVKHLNCFSIVPHTNGACCRPILEWLNEVIVDTNRLWYLFLFGCISSDTVISDFQILIMCYAIGHSQRLLNVLAVREHLPERKQSYLVAIIVMFILSKFDNIKVILQLCLCSWSVIMIIVH